MRLFAGTSGFSYKEWKGSFYPEDLPVREVLSYYSSHEGSTSVYLATLRRIDR